MINYKDKYLKYKSKCKSITNSEINISDDFIDPLFFSKN